MRFVIGILLSFTSLFYVYAHIPMHEFCAIKDNFLGLLPLYIYMLLALNEFVLFLFACIFSNGYGSVNDVLGWKFVDV